MFVVTVISFDPEDLFVSNVYGVFADAGAAMTHADALADEFMEDGHDETLGFTRVSSQDAVMVVKDTDDNVVGEMYQVLPIDSVLEIEATPAGDDENYAL